MTSPSLPALVQFVASLENAYVVHANDINHARGRAFSLIVGHVEWGSLLVPILVNSIFGRRHLQSQVTTSRKLCHVSHSINKWMWYFLIWLYLLLEDKGCLSGLAIHAE